MLKRLTLFGWLFTMLVSLQGCGFKLRGTHALPDAVRVMELQSVDKYSELARLLRTQLQANQVTLLDHIEPTTKTTRLKLFKDQLDRRTLSLFPNGQVAEYGLIYSVKYALLIDGQAPKHYDFEIYRDYQDDPKSTLAKSKELKLILNEMRQQAADKIIRQLASVHSDNKAAP